MTTANGSRRTGVETCFVAMPITTPVQHVATYHGDTDHFRHVLDFLFRPAVESAGLVPLLPAVIGSDLIHATMIKNIRSADLVLCDISNLNANVFLELGARIALNKPVALVRDQHTPVPFDTLPLHCHEYDAALFPWTVDKEIEMLRDHLLDTARCSAGSNPLWQRLGVDDPDGTTIEDIEDDASVRSTPRTSARGGPEPTDHELSAVDDLLDQIAKITYDLNATLSVERVEPDRIVLHSNGYYLGPRHRRAIAEVAHRHSLEVEIVGPGASPRTS